MGKKTWMRKCIWSQLNKNEWTLGPKFLAVKHFVLQMLPPTVFCCMGLNISKYPTKKKKYMYKDMKIYRIMKNIY